MNTHVKTHLTEKSAERWVTMLPPHLLEKKCALFYGEWEYTKIENYTGSKMGGGRLNNLYNLL